MENETKRFMAIALRDIYNIHISPFLFFWTEKCCRNLYEKLIKQGNFALNSFLMAKETKCF